MTEARSPARHLRIGLGVGLAFTATFLAWSLLANLQGAVVSTGELVYTDTREIEIRHGDGGPVAEVMVQSGSFVEAGDTLLRMDADLLVVEQRILQDRLFETRLRDHRLQTLIDGRPFLPLPDDLNQDNTTPETQRSVERERSAHEASKAQIAAGIATVEDAQAQAMRAAESARTTAQGLEAEMALIEADLVSQTTLLDKGLSQRSTVNALEREKIQAANDRNQAMDEAESQDARVGTLALERDRILAEYKVSLVEELGRAAEIVPELEERLAGIDARLARLEVRAPVSGHINNLSVTTAGVVIPPGAVIATLVPDSGDAHILTQIAPTQIDQVAAGQKAMLRPMTRAHNNIELTAQVVRVGEGVRRDPTTGAAYYEVLIIPNLDPLVAEGDGLVSGTPFEVAIETQARSPMAYFLEPVLRSFRRAMRE
jgi:HlyD family secretion protein